MTYGDRKTRAAPPPPFELLPYRYAPSTLLAANYFAYSCCARNSDASSDARKILTSSFSPSKPPILPAGSPSEAPSAPPAGRF